MAKKEAKEATRQARDWLPEETREHLHAARREWRTSMEMLLPPEFVQHRRAARREMLLAARSLIDHALKRMEERESG